MTDPEDRRRYTRIEFDGNALVKQDLARYPVHLIDVSLKGALVETPPEYSLNVDKPVSLDINLAGDITITMKARLVHSSSKVLGFHCESIDMDSMTHLRRLIELNMEDPQASERVLEELIATY